MRKMSITNRNIRMNCYWSYIFPLFFTYAICVNLYMQILLAATAAKSLQSCLTLCDPIDGNPPGSPVPGILQARTLEWGAISFSHAWKWKVKVKSLSHVRPSATPWIAAYQAPPSMGFSRQEYWSGLSLPSLANCAYNMQIVKAWLYPCSCSREL